ncbi:MAG: amidohydrolase family protein [Scardovia wiggsiae]
MIIDGHQHVMLPTTFQLAKMDEAGVDKAVLFTTTPHVERAEKATLKEISREMAVLYNILNGSYTVEERLAKIKEIITELKTAISIAPDRFAGFGTTPLGLSEEETSQWVEDYVVSNSFKGVGEYTPGTIEQMGQLETVFSSLTDFSQLAIWVHTFSPVTSEGIKILMGYCEKYPKIPVIFGHLGGSSWMDVIQFAKDHKNAYIDMSAAFTPLAVRTALTETPEQCLFGSDAPFGEPFLSRQLIEYVSPSEEAARLALGENIARLLQL